MFNSYFTLFQAKIHRFVYDIIISTEFHVSISVVVVLYIASLAFEYYNQPKHYDKISNILNSTFVTIFGLEIIFKLIGLRYVIIIIVCCY